MKKFLFTLLALGTLISFSQTQMKCAPGKCGSAMKSNTVVKKENKEKYCGVCGMKLKMFPQTKHKAQVNGKTKEYCSIHCLAADIRKGVHPKHIKVTDAETLKDIDASKAFYVITKQRRGTMSTVSKLAFISKNAAMKFAKKYGGKITDFSGALAEAYKDFEKK